MPYVALDGLRLYYEERNRPDGPPLVLLHGFNGTGRAWRGQLGPFGATYRLIVPDLRGHGRTDNPGGLPAMNHRQFGRDIVALCRELDLRRPIFVGHSTGAMLQLTIGVEAPDLPRALVLSAGTYFFGDPLRAWWRSGTVDERVPPERRAELQAAHTALGQDHWRLVAEAFLALHRHAHTDDFPEAEELRGIRAPTLILHGDRDWFFPVEVPVGLYRLIPESELCILPNTDHGLPFTHGKWFNEIVLDFLLRRAAP